jgi:hypothetical protein
MTARPNSAKGDWIKQLRFDMAFAERTLLEQGEVSAMFVVHTKDAKHVIGAPARDDAEKRVMLAMVRAYCIALDAQALTFVSEAWLRSVQRAPNETEREFQARTNAVRPREAEDRVEVVMVVLAFRDGAGERQIVSDTKEIERRANGKPSGLKPYQVGGQARGWSGRMVDIFPEEAPTEVERLAARAVLRAAGLGELG